MSLLLLLPLSASLALQAADGGARVVDGGSDVVVEGSRVHHRPSGFSVDFDVEGYGVCMLRPAEAARDEPCRKLQRRDEVAALLEESEFIAFGITTATAAPLSAWFMSVAVPPGKHLVASAMGSVQGTNDQLAAELGGQLMLDRNDAGLPLNAVDVGGAKSYRWSGHIALPGGGKAAFVGYIVRARVGFIQIMFPPLTELDPEVVGKYAEAVMATAKFAPGSVFVDPAPTPVQESFADGEREGRLAARQAIAEAKHTTTDALPFVAATIAILGAGIASFLVWLTRRQRARDRQRWRRPGQGDGASEDGDGTGS